MRFAESMETYTCMETVIWRHCLWHASEDGGYVVSDEYFESAGYSGERVYKLSQIGAEEPLIVAMTGKVALQVINKVRDRVNVLFLSVDPKIRKSE